MTGICVLSAQYRFFNGRLLSLTSEPAHFAHAPKCIIRCTIAPRYICALFCLVLSGILPVRPFLRLFFRLSASVCLSVCLCYLCLSHLLACNFYGFLCPQKPIETPQEILERAAKKGLVKGKAKPARVATPKASGAKARPPAFLSVTRAKEDALSDSEIEPNKLKIPTKKREPRSWQGSAEELANAEVKSKTTPKKKEKAKQGFSQAKRFVFQ